jgi:hypothetical protein
MPYHGAATRPAIRKGTAPVSQDPISVSLQVYRGFGTSTIHYKEKPRPGAAKTKGAAPVLTEAEREKGRNSFGRVSGFTLGVSQDKYGICVTKILVLFCTPRADSLLMDFPVCATAGSEQ